MSENKPLNVNERLFQKSLEQFPVIDYDFFNTISFDVCYDEEFGYNLNFVYAFVDEEAEYPNKFGFVQRTSIVKDSLPEIAETVLSYIQSGLWQDLDKSFFGMLFDDSGNVTREIDWMEELSQSDDVLKIEGLNPDGSPTGEVYKNPNKSDEEINAAVKPKKPKK
jgi:hypothetical protein